MGRTKDRGHRTKAIVLCLLSFVLSWGLGAAPVSADSARRAADRWLRLRPAAHMKARFGARKAAGVKTFRADGEDAFHIVSIEGGGFIVVSADDRVEPVVAFTDSGTLDEDPRNPLWALLNADVPQRLRAHRRGAVRHRRGLRPGEDWKDLLSAAAATATPRARQTSVADVRVEPLVQSKWSQSTAASKKCYNTYTPNGYVCGCVATAAAQLMRYHQFPTAAVSPVTMSCWVDDKATDKTMMGGVYDWAAMPLVPGSSTTEAQRQAIGKLCYDVGVASRMDWCSDGSGACPAVIAQSLTSVFGYASSKCQLSSVDDSVIENAIFANLDAKCPVLLGISGSGGHEIVADGYGFSDGAVYTHLNLGWGGSNDAWYALPEVSTSNYDFDSVDSVVYNVFPTETGELLTGRVLDKDGEPVVGARVDAANGSTVRSATTDAHGVYAVRVTGGKTWSVAATVSGGTSDAQKVSVGTSKSSTLSAVNVGSYSYIPLTGSVGNRWGNDIVLPDFSVPRVSGIRVCGPDALKPGDSAAYVCVADYTDGSFKPVDATWKLSDSTSGILFWKKTYATMDTPGVLRAETSGKTVKLTATHSADGKSWSVVKQVKIDDGAAAPGAVPSLADLQWIFADDSELITAVDGETKLAAFNAYLRACGVESAVTLSEGQRRWAYRSYRMSALASVPELYEEEPELRISRMDVADGICSFAVSLTAGARQIALAREALADSIRVGTSLDHVDAKPEIVAAPSADGANLVFTVKPPGTSQGFIAIFAQ